MEDEAKNVESRTPKVKAEKKNIESRIRSRKSKEAEDFFNAFEKVASHMGDEAKIESRTPKVKAEKNIESRILKAESPRMLKGV